MTVSGSSNRIDELKGLMRNHEEEVIRQYELLFSRMPKPPSRRTTLLIEHVLGSGAAYYFNNSESSVEKLEFPKELEKYRDQIKGHLGDSNWRKWQGLVEDANAYLDSVVLTWKEISGNLAGAAKSIGLFPWENLSDPPIDSYWPSFLVSAIWGDVEYYERKGVHLWDGVKLVQETIQVKQPQYVELNQTWVIEGFPWVRSQSKEAVEMMKRAWAEEALRIEPKVRELASKRGSIEDKIRDLQAIQRRADVEHTESNGDLPNSCPTCEPWKEEIARMSRAPSEREGSE